MKTHKISGIDSRLSSFYRRIHKLIKDIGCEYPIEFFEEACFISCGESPDWCPTALEDIEEVANKCGFRFMGIGASRITLGFYYRSRFMVVKVCYSDDSNDREWRAARQINSRQWLKKVCLTPLYSWKNEKWGRVIVYPSVETISDPTAPEPEAWNKKNFPFPRPWNPQFKKIVKAINYLTHDAHSFNVGFHCDRLVLFDYDHIDIGIKPEGWDRLVS